MLARDWCGTWLYCVDIFLLILVVLIFSRAAYLECSALTRMGIDRVMRTAVRAAECHKQSKRVRI